jgi:hypothetical protein
MQIYFKKKGRVTSDSALVHPEFLKLKAMSGSIEPSPSLGAESLESESLWYMPAACHVRYIHGLELLGRCPSESY